MKPFTDITVLLDRSGSMESIRRAMQSAFNEFVTTHKANPSTRLTLIEFDSPNAQQWVSPTLTAYPALYNQASYDFHVVYENWPITEVPALELVPRGGTPLLHAMCDAIDRTGARLKALHPSERPNGVLFVVITDGEENTSFGYTRDMVKQRVTKQMNDFQWQFVYLGANQDAVMEAQSFGIAADRAVTYHATGYNTKNLMRSVTANTMAYTSSIAGGETSVDCGGLVDFNAQQRESAVEDEAA